jgi:serine-type D-Ala-D-Ala carboxypeptidase/endopeptidase (penicillin-binding protein 4)
MEFTMRGTTGRPPASVEKLYTTLSVLRRLGPDARLRTQVLGVGHLSRGGTWVGNLYLKGGGDPTFGDGTFQRVYLHGEGSSVTDLVQQLAGKGIKRVTGQVIADASLFDNARGGMLSKLAADVPDFGGQLSALVYDHGATMGLLSPGAFAARQLTVVMKSAGITAKPGPGNARTPHHAHHLASVSSPPMWQLLHLMDVPSDDLFAEMLTKQLGSRFDDHKGTIAGGARVIADDIHTYGIHPKIVDGSGLSRQDRSSPAQVVTMLSSVWHTPDGRVLAGSLPVVGQTGTVQRIAPKTVAAGRCVAKTGTLDNVTNLAGYCRTLRGHTVAFAVFIDGPDNQTALSVIARFAITLVRSA